MNFDLTEEMKKQLDYMIAQRRCPHRHPCVSFRDEGIRESGRGDRGTWPGRAAHLREKRPGNRPARLYRQTGHHLPGLSAVSLTPNAFNCHSTQEYLSIRECRYFYDKMAELLEKMKDM